MTLDTSSLGFVLIERMEDRECLVTAIPTEAILGVDVLERYDHTSPDSTDILELFIKFRLTNGNTFSTVLTLDDYSIHGVDINYGRRELNLRASYETELVPAFDAAIRISQFLLGDKAYLKESEIFES